MALLVCPCMLSPPESTHHPDLCSAKREIWMVEKCGNPRKTPRGTEKTPSAHPALPGSSLPPVGVQVSWVPPGLPRSGFSQWMMVASEPQGMTAQQRNPWVFVG